MKAWKFIAVLAVLVTGLSLYQLSFTFKANSIDQEAIAIGTKKAEELALANPSINKDSVITAEKKAYIESKWDEVVYLGFPLKKVKKFAINLGLDLQGGTHATVIVAPDDIMTRMSNNNTDSAFVAAVQAAKLRMNSTQAKFTSIFLEEWKKRAGDRDLNEIFLSSSNENVTLETSDDDIIKMIDDELDLAVDRSVIVLRSRIDEFGATNPIIHPVKSTGRIEIELPGFDNEQLIRTQLEKVAHLEFIEPYEYNEFQNIYGGLNAYYSAKEKANEVEKDDVVEELAVNDSLALDSLEVDSTALAQDSTEAEQSSFEKMFTFAGGAMLVKSSELGKAKTILATEEFKALLPTDLTFMFDKEARDLQNNGTMYYYLYPMKKGQDAPALMDGNQVEDAYVTRHEGGLAAGIKFKTEGSLEWANITEKFLKKPIGIVLDNEVYSMPTIQEKMNTGSCVVSGNFSYEEAATLTNILKAGKLPAPTIIERLVKVGPSLGAEAIQQGLFSLIGGLLLVIGFMIAYYNKAGLVAVIGLFFNLLFIIGILATPSYGVTLTLAGMAGIVLTIGMSVDANVLIFERIKEELRNGASNEHAIESGYSRAFWTIFDANITTFLSALVLYIFGTGLVKGFAVTLMVGVVCSFFAAVFITRLIIFLMGRNKKYENVKFTTPISEGLFQGKTVDFISKRKMGYIFSAVVIIAGIGLMMKDGLNLGVAFKGGYSYVYSFDKPVSATQARESIKVFVKDADVQVKEYDKSNQIAITTSYMIDSNDPEATKLVQSAVEQGLGKFGEFKQLQSIQVGGTIADDIRDSSIKAMIIALFAIFLYIVFRFRNWQFGLGSLVALLHDVFFVLAIFAIARAFGYSFEIDEVFIAAMLTLVGYSINDTVVVFDHVREYMGKNGLTLKESLNQSLSNTLSRTLMTSLTTLFVVLVLFIFGGEALRGFSFALLVGILVGTYSSLFVATPLVYDTTAKEKE